MYRWMWSHIYMLGLGVADKKTLLWKNCDTWKIIVIFEIDMRKKPSLNLKGSSVKHTWCYCNLACNFAVRQNSSQISSEVCTTEKVYKNTPLCVLMYESNSWPRVGAEAQMPMLLVLEFKGHRNWCRLHQNSISSNTCVLKCKVWEWNF